MKRTVSFVLYVAQKSNECFYFVFFRKKPKSVNLVLPLSLDGIFSPLYSWKKNTKSAYAWLISFAFDPIFVPDALDHGRISQNLRGNIFFYIEM